MCVDVYCPYCNMKTMLTIIEDKTPCFHCGKYFKATGKIVFIGTIEKLEGDA